MDQMKIQGAEFDAMAELAKQWHRLTLTPVVDDDYPEVRHGWESALAGFVAALHNNGRDLTTGRPARDVSRGLSFAALREANIKRLPLFKGNAGQQAHSHADGSDWSINDWLVAVMGELGEAANVAKKLRRGDFDEDDLVPADIAAKEGITTYGDWLANEMADVAIYLDILVYQFRVDLGEAIRRKFNATSRKIGVEVML